MMMGPTKKKVITTGIIAFTIPVVLGGVAFMQYNKKVQKTIADLEKKSETTKAYVFKENMLEGEVISSGDLVVVDIKAESAPIDYFPNYMSLDSLLGRRMRINAEQRTIVTESMLMDEVDLQPGLSERLQEFNMLLLPSDLNQGDYVDIRITFPSGENYVVVAGKEVKKLGTTVDSNTIFLQLDEEEIVRTTAAILESYMSDGIKIYVTKYVEPSAQLYKSERVDFVKKFEDTLERLYAEREALLSGDNADVERYISLYAISEEKAEEIKTALANGEMPISKENITNAEIASIIGLEENQVSDIRTALNTLAKNSEKASGKAENERLEIVNSCNEVLSIYEDKLVRTRTDMKETYPVRENIAIAIAENPNILADLKARYNIEDLIAKRARIKEFAAYKLNEDTGEIETTEALSNIQTNLNKEIELQKSERKEYLQALLLEE